MWSTLALWLGVVAAEPRYAALPCTRDSSNLLYVSTLDGRVSALDADRGELKWTFDHGKPLLSSSIHRLELSNGGQWMRLVPSLSGTLYRFSGDNLEPLPLSADQLLSSSFKYSDDLVVAGAKETISYGVNTDTGKLVYECSVNGCVNTTEWKEEDNNQIRGSDIESGDIVVVRSVSQTVRAFEPRSGQEKWNFSVGQHELTLQPFTGCILHDPPPKRKQELLFKVIVPEGLICAVQKNAPHNVVWKHKLNSPIVNAWSTQGVKLNPIDLFGVPHVPALNSGEKSFLSPAVYIGMHERQLYVQESVRMQALVQSQTRQYIASAHDKENFLLLPWRPLPARSVSEWDPDRTALSTINENDYETTALSVLYASEYVNGNGYYLYTEQDRKTIDDPTCNRENSSLMPLNDSDAEEEIETDEGFNFEDIAFEPLSKFGILLKYWWKEVSVIAITTALFYNYVYNRIRGRVIHREFIHTEYVVVKHVDNPITSVSLPSTSQSTPSENSPPIFTSRYLTDFIPIKCLGRGGFGVVFEAMNKIDECNYAVKRITLPNKKEQRQRVLREVRALAKLDHNNIVRYFNSWLEEPPFGWEDPFEKELCQEKYLSDTYSKIPPISDVDVKSLEDSKLPHKKDNTKDSFSTHTSNNFHGKLSPTFSMSRQRSYSMNDSFSIVFENNSKDSSKSFSIISINDSSEGPQLKKIFAITNSDRDEVDGPKEDIEKQTCEIVDESVCKTKPKHKRNFSLDLNKVKLNSTPKAASVNVYLYIQMQLCQEKSLREWLKENICSEIRQQQFVNMFEQIVHAVEYVHLQRLIHRDLKPSNIFFSANGQIKIGDFGLVTTMTDPFSNEAFKNTINNHIDIGSDKFTQHVGTLLYMSPEQLRGEAHNFKVDIWALGLVLVELLIPFGTEMEKIRVLQDLRENRYPKNFQFKYPNEYVLLQQMLSPEPSKRPSTFGVRAHPPLSHKTDPRYHFCLPPLPQLPRSTTSSVSI